MTSYDWQTFLQELNHAIFESPYLEALDVPMAVIESGWLGFPGATESQITAAESRLGTVLPPSYRAFLQVSNGWYAMDTCIDRLWSAEDVTWLADRHQEDLIDPWMQGEALMGGLPPVTDEKYFVYGPEQDPVHIRTEYLHTALAVSEVMGGAIVLLNPQIVTPDGEWEAWFFASWLPGAIRYRSFWDLMQAHYDGFLAEMEAASRVLELDDSPDEIKAKVLGMIQDLEDRATQYATHQDPWSSGLVATLQAVVADIRDALQTDDLDALPDRLEILADEYLRLADALQPQMEAGLQTAQQEALRDQLANGEFWQRWQAEMQEGNPERFHLPQIPSEMAGQLQEMLAAQMQNMDLMIMAQQTTEGGQAEGYRQGAGLLRYFLGYAW